MRWCISVKGWRHYLCIIRRTGLLNRCIFGHIVNLSSVGGLYPSNVGAGYGVAKAAVHKMSLDLRFDLGGSRIRVTEIAPGLVRSEFIDVRFGGDKEKVGRQFRNKDGDIAPTPSSSPSRRRGTSTSASSS